MSLLIRSPFLSAGKESDDSIPPFLLILPHQQHVISDCGVCLRLMLQSRRNNERVRRDGGTGRWGSEEESHGRVLTDQSIDISTWLNLKKVCTSRRIEDGDGVNKTDLTSLLLSLPALFDSSFPLYPSLSRLPPGRLGLLTPCES